MWRNVHQQILTRAVNEWSSEENTTSLHCNRLYSASLGCTHMHVFFFFFPWEVAYEFPPISRPRLVSDFTVFLFFFFFWHFRFLILRCKPCFLEVKVDSSPPPPPLVCFKIIAICSLLWSFCSTPTPSPCVVTLLTWDFRHFLKDFFPSYFLWHCRFQYLGCHLEVGVLAFIWGLK